MHCQVTAIARTGSFDIGLLSSGGPKLMFHIIKNNIVFNIMKI